MVFLGMSNERKQDKRKKGLEPGVSEQNQVLRIAQGIRSDWWIDPCSAALDLV